MTTTQVLLIEAKPSVPIACDMTAAGDTAEARFAEYGRLFAHALIDRQRSGDAVVFTFAAKPGVTEWVADLARREAACCPFSTYDVTSDGARVVWKTSSQAAPMVQAFLDEFYGLPERIGDGLQGMFARLADRGLTITSPAPGHFAVEERAGAAGLLDRVKAACGC
jgi:hypothetical protein